MAEKLRRIACPLATSHRLEQWRDGLGVIHDHALPQVLAVGDELLVNGMDLVGVLPDKQPETSNRTNNRGQTTVFAGGSPFESIENRGLYPGCPLLLLPFAALLS